MVDFAGIDLDESPTDLVLHIGDEAPTFTDGHAMEVSGNGRGALIPISGWGDKTLSGTAISYRKELPSEAHAWERVAELTLTGTAQSLHIEPGNGEPDALFKLELAEPGPGGWRVLIHARGRTRSVRKASTTSRCGLPAARRSHENGPALGRCGS
ncbi:hypothetical protein DY245_33205 [Streptomyces inhibens]|uniref:Uncharacterized protein n=1 Tax=Streptomyces inhibens TaxID=2293571 RepID=A0A371PVY3_STRIH|nr:hypothetical protein [Streptomyces inhibens]REK86313.1 hypothetical protein DY245_33205 [Streptomyces inhibens]